MWFVAIILLSVANVALCADSLILSGTSFAVGDTLTVFVTRAAGQETSTDWVAITTLGNVIINVNIAQLDRYLQLSLGSGWIPCISTVGICKSRYIQCRLSCI